MKNFSFKKCLVGLLAICAIFMAETMMGSGSGEPISLSEQFVENPEPIYAMALTGIDISDLNLQLGAYMRVKKNEIFQLIFQGIELETHMNPVPGISDEYAFSTASVDELLQPHQCGWTPKGEVVFKGRVNKVRQIKMDYEIECIDEIQRSWIGFLAAEGVDRKKWPLVRYIVEKHLVPKVSEEIDAMSYNGVYAAPAPGVPGASLTSVNGLAKEVVDAIAAADIVPIPVAAITPTNIVDQVEIFCDSLPNKYKNLKTPIYMSKTNATRYWRDYRAKFGGNVNYDGKDNQRVDATSKTIVGLDTMEGSDRFIHTTSDNLIYMYDKIKNPKGFTVEVAKRVISIFTDFKRGYGWRKHGEMFVSSNA